MPNPISRLNAALEGRYRIERQLGEGGMATVYLADDLKHERRVALKVLKPELAAVVGAERFLAEIKTTANLQHPHILPLFDSGEADSFLFYVMPYLQGESLRERLNREHQLPVDEAVQIARSVAEALDYAHRQGVIHRDIKPANILLQDGKPVVSDFGIALALGVAGAGRLTETGLSLGTPHYMSPEQATGDQSVGAATDIYSIGCVLFEMLVGQPPYTGSTPQAVLGKIVTGDVPSATAERRSVPANVDAAIRKALEKLPADRFFSAAEMAQALAARSFRYGPEASAETPSARERPWRTASLALTLLVGLMAGIAASALLRSEAPGSVSRYALVLPTGQARSTRSGVSFALSADGERLVYPGDNSLWMLERRNQLEGSAIEGSSGALQPFFSPDGTQVAFVTDESQLVAVTLSGAPARTVVPTNVWPSGGDWSVDGYIYYTSDAGLGLWRTLADGTGEPEMLTRLDTGEVVHGRPHALPGGRGLLFEISLIGASTLAVLDLQSRERRVLRPGQLPRFSQSGHLVFLDQDGTLTAARFDPQELELEGAAMPLVSSVLDYSLSPSGRLVYLIGGRGGGQVVSIGRDGSSELLDSAWTGVSDVRVSPDGSMLAAVAGGDIWVRSLRDASLEQLTFDGSSSRPEWTPDGQSVTYLSDGNLYRMRADASDAPELLKDVEESIQEGLLTPSGDLILRVGVQEERDLFVTSPGFGSLRALVATPAGERAPALSPDGRLLAYVSLEGDRDDVYVRPFPNVDDWVQNVSLDGGTEPQWSRDGTELFYRDNANQLVALAVRSTPEFLPGRRTVLFSMSDYGSNPNHAAYGVTASADRFMMTRAAALEQLDQLVSFENFSLELRERLGN